jgi:hypothetical protein
MFFGTTTGTGSSGNDYAATIAVASRVPFPQNGPSIGPQVTRNSPSDFRVGVAGLYEVSWSIEFAEPSQLAVARNAGVLVTNADVVNDTCNRSGAGTQLNTNTVLVQLAAGDLVSIVNPPGNATALTVDPGDGTLTHAQAPNVVIRLIA